MAQHYDFCDDYMTIVAGTSNTIARAYIEASEHVEDNDDAGTKYLKKFVTSIEKLAKSSKVNDSRITSSKGNLKSFSDYENIEYMLNFLSKYVKESIVSDLKKIHSEILSCASEYETGYDKKVRLIELEYESGVYLLITGLVYTMSNCIEFSQQNGGFNIIKKAIDKKDLLVKMINKFAKQISDKNHKEYLKKLAQVSTEVKRDSGRPVAESYEGEYTIESVVGETLDLIDGILTNISRIGTGAKNIYRTVKKSMFGIIPMVRGIIYLHYKKKADHIANLEQQCEFIKLNIDQINRRTDISPEEKERLTKKQQAYANAYAKKAAKIRAELDAQCRDAAASLEKDRADIKDAPNSKDDDMVLESSDFFYMMEKKSRKVTKSLQIKAWELFSKYCENMDELDFSLRIYENRKHPEKPLSFYYTIIATDGNKKKYTMTADIDFVSPDPIVNVCDAWEDDRASLKKGMRDLIDFARTLDTYKPGDWVGSGFKFKMTKSEYDRMASRASNIEESSNLFATDPHTRMNDDYGVLDEDPDFIDSKPNDDYEEPRLSKYDDDMTEDDSRIDNDAEINYDEIEGD